MSMDGQTPADHSFLARPFIWGTRLILAYPVATIALAIGFSLVALALSWTRLGYRTSRLDLVNPKSDYNRLWLEYIKEFGEADDAVIVVEGAGREQVVPVLEELSTAPCAKTGCFTPCCTKWISARSAPRACII